MDSFLLYHESRFTFWGIDLALIQTSSYVTRSSWSKKALCLARYLSCPEEDPMGNRLFLPNIEQLTAGLSLLLFSRLCIMKPISQCCRDIFLEIFQVWFIRIGMLSRYVVNSHVTHDCTEQHYHHPCMAVRHSCNSGDGMSPADPAAATFLACHQLLSSLLIICNTSPVWKRSQHLTISHESRLMMSND